MVWKPPGSPPLQEHLADSPGAHPHDGGHLLLPQPRGEQGGVVSLQDPQGQRHYHMLTGAPPRVSGHDHPALLGPVNVLHPGVQAHHVPWDVAGNCLDSGVNI